MNIKRITLVVIFSVISSISSLFSNEYSGKNDNVIYLIGEDHDNPECLQIKDQLLKDTQNGKIILALEGREFVQKNNNNIFGIENLYSKLLVDSWGFHQQFVMYKISQDLGPEILALMPSIKKAFNIFFSFPSEKLNMLYAPLHHIDELQNIYNKNPEIIGEFVKLYKLNDSSPSSYKKTISKYLKNHSFETPFFLNIYPDISLWINLFTDYMIFFVEKINLLNEGIDPHTLNTVIDYIEKIKNGLKSKNYSYFNEIPNFEKFFVENITMNHRNQVFLKNIVSIFEENKLQEKPLYVIVGYKHIPFLNEALKQKGFQVKLNDWEKYRVDLTILLQKSEL